MRDPLIFYGNSDDTFGEYNRTDVDHDNCANGKPIVFRVVAHTSGGTEQLFVWGQYAPIPTGGPCWVVGVAPCEEDALPSWPMRLVPGDNGYTYALFLDAPENATVKLEAPADGA
jgi:hypothetical protein